jgi:hypothetical protein
MLCSAPLILIMAMATGANAACRRGLNSYPNYFVGCQTDEAGTVCRSEELPGGPKGGCAFPTVQNNVRLLRVLHLSAPCIASNKTV